MTASSDYATILDPFLGQKGAAIDALKAVQDRFGYVSDEAIDAVAEALGLSRNTVYGVVSYYEFFHQHPLGANVIRFCMGTVCDALGGRAVLAEVTRLTGARVFETSADGRWTVERLPCFGTCARGPMMQINDEAHCNLTVESVREIVLSGRAGEPAPIAGDGKPGVPAEEPTQ